jgi:hypothetical protein
MTRVVASPLPPSIITTVATGLLLLALGVDLPDGLRRPICSASAPVTTTTTASPVRLRHHSSTTVKTSSIIAADVTAAGNQSSSSVAHNNNNNNNNGATKRGGRMERRNRQQQQDKDDLSLWIDQQQVKMFSGKQATHSIISSTLKIYLFDLFRNSIPYLSFLFFFKSMTFLSTFSRLSLYKVIFLHSILLKKKERRKRIDV